jgi:hypothetical protein
MVMSSAATNHDGHRMKLSAENPSFADALIGMEATTMKKGLIVKILHNGQEVYGAVSEFDETMATVRFPLCRVSGTVQIAQATVRQSDCRKPTMGQDSEVAVLVR